MDSPEAEDIAALRQLQERARYLAELMQRTKSDLEQADRAAQALQQQSEILAESFLDERVRRMYVDRSRFPAPTAELWQGLQLLPGGDEIPSLTRYDDSVAELQRVAAQHQANAALLRLILDAHRRELKQVEAQAEELTAKTTAWIRSGVHGAPMPVPDLNAPNATGYTGGRLLWPVIGGMTSEFGNRFDPYFHRWQLHAGIDIGAGNGAPLRAAAGGIVRIADFVGGYGNYTCIDHGQFMGQRLSTCYGHQSRITVVVGQRVAAGQLIGRVGETGAATGPHVHFEVRLGGRPVNPQPWLE